MKPSQIFIHKLFPLGAVPYGTEVRKYESLLQREGFTYASGAWVLRPEARVILTAHLDTVEKKAAKSILHLGSIMKGKDGAIFGDDKAGVALVLYLHTRLPEVGFALFLGEEKCRKGSKEAEKAGLFPNARAMISLDRRGKEEIIYVQNSKETGSIEATELNRREALLPAMPAKRGGPWSGRRPWASPSPRRSKGLRRSSRCSVRVTPASGPLKDV